MQTIFLDCEIYRNYFLTCFEVSENFYSVEITDESTEDEIQRARVQLNRVLKKNLSVTFNGNNFDMVLLSAFINHNFSISGLKKLCDELIKSNKPAWMVARDADIILPIGHPNSMWKTIDLINVLPGIASLKMYAARLEAESIQDLPLDPDSLITPEQMPNMRKYCFNDCANTRLAFEALGDKNELLQRLSEDYGMELRSFSDAQLAETLIKAEFKKLTGKDIKKDYGEDVLVKPFHYDVPDCVGFTTPLLQELLRLCRKVTFDADSSGKLRIPAELAKFKIHMDGTDFAIGIGGLHSKEKDAYYEVTDNTMLIDLDVTSYYPAIIIQNELYPEKYGKDFIDLYKRIVADRVNAKRTGNKVRNETLKIVINSSFGKFGNKYSSLYSPKLLIQTTITGQLLLLMLIERFNAIDGVRVVSANTDGVVIEAQKSALPEVGLVELEWMLDTNMNLERSEYKKLLSFNVNNYIAVMKHSDEVKLKGAFSNSKLAKNPDRQIIYKAIVNYIAKGTPLKETIEGCDDITQFLIARKVTGGAVHDGVEIGKVVRYYYSKSAAPDSYISYKTNGNKVPNSLKSKPLVTLDRNAVQDVDFQRYIDEAKDLIGFVL